MSLGALTVYVVVAGASVLYSVAPLPTAGKVFELGVGLAIVWAIAMDRESGDRLRHAIRFVLQLEIALLLVAVVGFLAMPGIFSRLRTGPASSSRPRWSPPATHSNGLSAAGALIAVYAVARALEPLDEPLEVGGDRTAGNRRHVAGLRPAGAGHLGGGHRRAPLVAAEALVPRLRARRRPPGVDPVERHLGEHLEIAARDQQPGPWRPGAVA